MKPGEHSIYRAQPSCRRPTLVDGSNGREDPFVDRRVPDETVHRVAPDKPQLRWGNGVARGVTVRDILIARVPELNDDVVDLLLKSRIAKESDDEIVDLLTPVRDAWRQIRSQFLATQGNTVSHQPNAAA